MKKILLLFIMLSILSLGGCSLKIETNSFELNKELHDDYTSYYIYTTIASLVDSSKDLTIRDVFVEDDIVYMIFNDGRTVYHDKQDNNTCLDCG